MTPATRKTVADKLKIVESLVVAGTRDELRTAIKFLAEIIQAIIHDPKA